jgi:hypothetical protein
MYFTKEITPSYAHCLALALDPNPAGNIISSEAPGSNDYKP